MGNVVSEFCIRNQMKIGLLACTHALTPEENVTAQHAIGVDLDQHGDCAAEDQRL